MRLRMLNILRVMMFLVFGICVTPNQLLASEELPFVTVEFPPFGFADGEKITGAGTEIIKAVTTRMGYTPTFAIYPTKRAQFEAMLVESPEDVFIQYALAMLDVSEGLSGGEFNGRSCPSTRIWGGELVVRWRSEAP